MVAQRMSLFSVSGTANARAAAKAAAASGKEIIDLSAGEIWAETPEAVRRGAVAAINRNLNRYTDTVGTEQLREAIAKKLSVDTGQLWRADEIAVTAGAKQALFNAALALLNPGDEVIIPAPYWTTFPAQVSIAGARPVFVDTRANGYVPRIEDIRAAISPSTRAIVVNTPNNPTGAILDRELLNGITELALEHDFWVIFDECYGNFVFEPGKHEHIAAVNPEARRRIVVVNSFSKSLTLTGWRLGYLAAPREVISAAKALQSHTTSNPNVVAQHAVLAYFEDGDRSFERGLRARLALNRTRGLAILSRLRNVPPPPAQGGFYFYLDLSGLVGGRSRDGAIATADDVANLLLREAGVASVPGSAFGDPTGMRLSYGIPVDLLERGLESLVDTLNGLS